MTFLSSLFLLSLLFSYSLFFTLAPMCSYPLHVNGVHFIMACFTDLSQNYLPLLVAQKYRDSAVCYALRKKGGYLLLIAALTAAPRIYFIPKSNNKQRSVSPQSPLIKVFLRSNHMPLLTPVAEALRCFLFPLQWQVSSGSSP